MKKKGLIEGKKAREYDIGVKSPEYKLFNNFIFKNIKLSKSARICDIGCGIGDTVRLLKNKVKEIVGIDGSTEMIKICKEKFGNDPKIKLKIVDADKTNLKSNYFDYIIVKLTLHHIKEKEKVMNEVYRILKPKGKVIVIDKFYLSKIGEFLHEIKELIFEFDTSLFNHFVKSKKYNENILSKKFDIIKKVYPPKSKAYSGQIFMFVLKKK